MLALIIQSRFKDSNEKRFRVPSFEVISKVFLQYSKVVHKEFVSHLLDESFLRIWRNIGRSNGGFQIQSARKKNDVSDFQVFGIKMTGHTGLEEKSKKN